MSGGLNCMQRILYHGSEKIIKKPEYGLGNKHNDYGLGFYCCTNLNLSKEWASRKYGKGFSNKYSFRDDRLNILDLTKPDYTVFHWVALLMHNRSIRKELRQNYPRELDYLEQNYLIDLSPYDVIIGYRADDSYFRFPEAFIQSRLTFDSLEKIYNAGDLGKQYVLLSKRAFDLIKFIEAIESDEAYQVSYQNRVNSANDLYEVLLAQDQYSGGTRLIDLVKDK